MMFGTSTRNFLITIIGLLGLGFVIRLILLTSNVSETFGSRIEVSTPLNAWKRAVEGVYLQKQGLDPYDGDVFHETPFALSFYELIVNEASEWIPHIFAVCDVMTAVIIALSTSIYLKSLTEREKDSSMFPSSASTLLLHPEQLHTIPCYALCVYLFGPFALLSCAGKSTVTFVNLITAIFILLTISGRWVEASVFLGIISYHSFYHVNLIVPLVLLIAQNQNSRRKIVFRTIAIICVLLCTIAILLFISHKKTGSWKFLESTYGCMLSVPNLTPNIGLFWYFFTEMFEHFRVFFLWTFQLNAFIYTFPLAIRLRHEPVLLLYLMLMIITIFKSYPCIGDVSFYLSLLPMWNHLSFYMRQSFLVGCILASCTFLGPTLWHLWIYSGSANANFYFAITLAFNTGQIFLLTDTLSAYIKREYYLLNGVKIGLDGKPVLLQLK